METCIQAENKINAGNNRLPNGRFKKGFSGNPNGSNRHFIEELIEALEKKSKREGFNNFAELVAERATRYETVLIAVLKKVCPDLHQHSGSLEVKLTQEEKDARLNRLKGLLSVN